VIPLEVAMSVAVGSINAMAREQRDLSEARDITYGQWLVVCGLWLMDDGRQTTDE